MAIKVYTYDYESATIVESECETFGHPHRDSLGQTMYENTHFRTKVEAARKLVVNLEAAVSIDSRQRKEARDRLAKITQDLADDAERLVRAKALLEDLENGEA